MPGTLPPWRVTGVAGERPAARRATRWWRAATGVRRAAWSSTTRSRPDASATTAPASVADQRAAEVVPRAVLRRRCSRRSRRARRRRRGTGRGPTAPSARNCHQPGARRRRRRDADDGCRRASAQPDGARPQHRRATRPPPRSAQYRVAGGLVDHQRRRPGRRRRPGTATWRTTARRGWRWSSRRPGRSRSSAGRPPGPARSPPTARRHRRGAARRAPPRRPRRSSGVLAVAAAGRAPVGDRRAAPRPPRRPTSCSRPSRSVGTDARTVVSWQPQGIVRERTAVAVIDVAGFVADLKSHAIDHGFHVHDERHFVETYSLRQLWEVDLHPEEACNGPIDLHLSLEVDPRALLGFEDEVIKLDDPDDDPPDGLQLPAAVHLDAAAARPIRPTCSCSPPTRRRRRRRPAGRGLGDRLVRQRHRRARAQPVDRRAHPGRAGRRVHRRRGGVLRRPSSSAGRQPVPARARRRRGSTMS